MAKSNVGKKPITEEEYTTNKVLTVFSVCLLGVLVLMILQRLLNYGNTFMIGLIVTKILLAIGIIGVIGGLVMLGMERSGRRNSARRIVCGRNLLIASVVMTLCMSAISYVGTAPIKALYVILPVLAVFYLVYHSYSTEFFVITVDSGAALGLMWLAHRALVSSNFVWVAYAALIAAVVLTTGICAGANRTAAVSTVMIIGVTVIMRKALLLKCASAFVPVFFDLPCFARTELTTKICAMVRTTAAMSAA